MTELDYEKVRLAFDIEAYPPQARGGYSDYIITIRLFEKENEIETVTVPLCDPDVLFETFKDVMKGKWTKLSWGQPVIHPYLYINKSDNDYLSFSISPDEFPIPGIPGNNMGYLELSQIEDTIYSWLTENGKKSYDKWKGRHRREFKNVTIKVKPELITYLVSKDNYQKAILDLFERYVAIHKEEGIVDIEKMKSSYSEMLEL